MKDKNIAYFLLRITLGVNLLMHGLVRLFGDHASFVTKTSEGFKGLLPDFALSLFGWALPPVEVLIGVLLILGLFTRAAAILGAITMIVLVFGMSLKQNWEVVGTQMLYSLIYYFIISKLQYNTYSVDQWFNKSSS